MIYSPFPFKWCNGCARYIPATHQYFNLSSKAKDGLQSRCKECRNRHYQAHKVERIAYIKEWQKRNPEKTQKYKKKWRRDNSEYDRQWYRLNRDKTIASQRRYQKQHPETLYKASKKYRAAHPQKIRVQKSRREARKRSLPATFTVEQRAAMLNYWHNSCAYCGSLPGLFENMRLCDDHFIPINDAQRCPGTVAHNIVPACKACNSSKSDCDPAEWLIQKYGKRRASQILKRIEAYFAWVREQE